MKEKGTIVKNISNSYEVSTPLGNVTCTPRGLFRHEKIIPLVGDNVEIDVKNKTITKIFERTNLLDRPQIANIKYALIVTSIKEPNFNSMLLDRLIVRFLSKNVEPILIFTKIDIASKQDKKQFIAIKKYYESLGYKVLTNKKIFKIKKLLKNKIAFVAGQTGAGKSTLLNKLNKNLDIKTTPISKSLGRGVHTTRHTELYKISNFFIADTPGFSSIDLTDINKNDLKNYFVEFKNYSCKFKDCNHIKQKCEVEKNVENNNILKSRYINYTKIYKEISQ